MQAGGGAMWESELLHAAAGMPRLRKHYIHIITFVLYIYAALQVQDAACLLQHRLLVWVLTHSPFCHNVVAACK